MTTPEGPIPTPVPISENQPPIHRNNIVGLSGYLSIQQEPIIGHFNVAEVPSLVVSAVGTAEMYVDVEGQAGRGEADAYIDRVRADSVRSVVGILSAIENAKAQVVAPDGDTQFIPRDALQSPTMFIEKPSAATSRPTNAEQDTRKFVPVPNAPATELFALSGAFGVVVSGEDVTKKDDDAATVVVSNPEASSPIAALIESKTVIAGSTESFATTAKVEVGEPKTLIMPMPDVAQTPPVVAPGATEEAEARPLLPKRQPNASGHGVQRTFGTDITESKPTKAKKVAPQSDAPAIEVTAGRTFGSVVSGTTAEIGGVQSVDRNTSAVTPYEISEGLIEAYLGRESGRRSVAAKRLAGIMGTVGVVDLGSFDNL